MAVRIENYNKVKVFLAHCCLELITFWCGCNSLEQWLLAHVLPRVTDGTYLEQVSTHDNVKAAKRLIVDMLDTPQPTVCKGESVHANQRNLIKNNKA